MFQYFKSIISQRQGEIATMLTIATVLVLTLGVFVGTQLSQNDTDIRSRAANNCSISSVKLISKSSNAYNCEFSATPKTSYVCALIQPKAGSGGSDIIIAGQDASNWQGSWSGTSARVPLFIKPGQSVNGDSNYRVVAYDWADTTCDSQKDYSGANILSLPDGSAVWPGEGGTNPTNTPAQTQPTNTPAPNTQATNTPKPNQSTNTPVPPTATPTITCTYKSNSECNSLCGGDRLCTKINGCYHCPYDPTPTTIPTSTPTSTPVAPTPTAITGKYTKQIQWLDNTNSNNALCWVSWAEQSCSLSSSKSFGEVSSISCIPNRESETLSITNNGPSSISVECSRMTCNQCSQQPGTQIAKCNYNNSTAQPIANNHEDKFLSPGCTLTCTFDGGITNSCIIPSPTPVATSSQLSCSDIQTVRVPNTNIVVLYFTKDGQTSIITLPNAPVNSKFTFAEIGLSGDTTCTITL